MASNIEVGLRKASSYNFENQFLLANCYMNYALPLAAKMDDEAKDFFDKSLKLFDKISWENPRIPRFHRSYARVILASNLSTDDPGTTEQLAQVNDCLRRLERTLLQSPNDVDSILISGKLWELKCFILEDLGRNEESDSAFEKSEELVCLT